MHTADTMATQALLGWYSAHARPLPWRRMPGTPLPMDADWPYRVWLAEIMLQQTGVIAVQPYFARFTARWPGFAALAAADDAEVMQAWAGLGYYARARNLLAAARAVAASYDGQLPMGEAALRTLPGIGPYSAAAIAAFAFGQRAIIIDGNVERVISRYAAIGTPLPVARAEIAAVLERLTPPGLAAADFAQGLMDLATSRCTPRAPACPACPLQPGCAAAAAGTMEAFPVKAPRRARPLRKGLAWWLEAEGHVLLIQRPARGLLGGMAALPASDWAEQAPAATPPLAGRWQRLGAVRHGFTHFELELSVDGLRLPARPEVEGQWWPVDALPGLPTLFAKAATLARATPLPLETA